DVTISTGDDGEGKASMGMYVDPALTLPSDGAAAGDTVGGAHAGPRGARAIVGKLTPQDEVNGAKRVGTGTNNAPGQDGATGAISSCGDVGAIGGIRMKMHAALGARSSYCLSPTSNCDEVVGNIPKGLSVFSVDTLSDAYDAIVAIGKGETDSLPTC